MQPIWVVRCENGAGSVILMCASGRRGRMEDDGDLFLTRAICCRERSLGTKEARAEMSVPNDGDGLCLVERGKRSGCENSSPTI